MSAATCAERLLHPRAPRRPRRAGQGRQGRGAGAAGSTENAASAKALETRPEGDEKIIFQSLSQKQAGSDSCARCEEYKEAKTPKEAIRVGAVTGDIKHDLNKGFVKRAWNEATRLRGPRDGRRLRRHRRFRASWRCSRESSRSSALPPSGSSSDEPCRILQIVVALGRPGALQEVVFVIVVVVVVVIIDVVFSGLHGALWAIAKGSGT